MVCELLLRIRHVPPIKESGCCSGMVDWMKRWLIMRHPKPKNTQDCATRNQKAPWNVPPETKKHPGRGTRIISSRIAIQSNAMIKKHNGKVFWDHKNGLFVNFLDYVATLISKFIAVHLRGYSKKHVAEVQACCAKVSSFCRMNSGPLLPTVLVTWCGAATGRMSHTPYSPVSRPVTWLASDLEQTPTCSKPSLPDYRQLTIISSTPG